MERSRVSPAIDLRPRARPALPPQNRDRSDGRASRLLREAVPRRLNRRRFAAKLPLAPSALRPSGCQLPSETKPVQRWEEAFNAFLDGLPDRGRSARIAAGFGLIVLALVGLVLLNLSLRAWGLWGDLAFAVVVTTMVLWVLIQTTRPLLRRGKFRAFPRALAAAVTALVGVPVAAVTSPAGAILLGAPFVGWMALLLVRLRGEVRVRAPRDWPQALAYV